MSDPTRSLASQPSSARPFPWGGGNQSRSGPDNRPWDLLVLGGGTAGIVGAKTAARLGARVLLVERDRPGGDCLWSGCVPSKALLAAAQAAASARDAGRFGIDVPVIDVDFARVMGHVHESVTHIAPTDSVESLERAGVCMTSGTGVFIGPRSIDIDGTRVEFRQALLATGASPAMPPIPGLADAHPLTSDTIWDLEVLPRQLAVLGGGGIGCELGQAFSRLGSEVVLVEGADRLLPREDADASELVTDALTAEGVKIRTGVSVVDVSGRSGAGGALLMSDGSRVDFDQLLVAVGRTPRTSDLGLSAAGVTTDRRGFVTVDAHLRTSNKRIWAAGDLTGHPSSLTSPASTPASPRPTPCSACGGRSHCPQCRA